MAAEVLGRLFTALIVLLLAAPAFANPPAPAPGAAPVIVYIETDPWAMVIGSDSPQLVLYDDGTVIYRSDDGYRAVTLAPADSAALAAKVSLAGIPEYMDYAEGATDQPSSIIIDVRTQQAAQAYGATSRHREASAPDDKLLAMIDLLREYRSPDAVPWQPEVIEVMIWPYEYAPEASITWPKAWPGLDHPATVQRGDSYSLFVPITRRRRCWPFSTPARPAGRSGSGGGNGR